jgi:hemerythrin
MLLIREEAIDRMRRDHEAMLDLIRRIQTLCSERERVEDCGGCGEERRSFCRSHVEQLIRAFVEATLKHNAMESLYMDDGVPEVHRRAHNRAHMVIAEQLKNIRIVLAADGNTVRAVAGIDEVLAALRTHFAEYDSHLERYLLAPAA